MATKKKLLQGAAGTAAAAGGPLGVEDVFSTYLYEGNAAGQGATAQSITNNIDLSGEGGLVWIKNRDSGGTSAWSHYLFDTERGATKYVRTNVTNGEGTSNNSLSAFNSDGFTLGETGGTNNNGDSYASFTFRKAPKFFTIVQYTGDGTTNRQISHDLGGTVGHITVKKTSGSAEWFNWHRTFSDNQLVAFSGTYAVGTYSNYLVTADSTTFTVGNNVDVNGSGETYVAYLWAHNDGDGEFGPDGDQDIIKCGSYTGSSSGQREIDIGFEPQWVMIKKANGADDWVILDTTRGMSRNRDNAARLYANTNGSESLAYEVYPHSNGFALPNNTEVNNSSFTYIYIAIRKGLMNTPTDAADVFDIDTHDSTEPLYDTNFTVDFGFYKRPDISGAWYVGARLLGGSELSLNNNALKEYANAYHAWDYSDGWGDTGAGSSGSYSWMWRQAHGYFDVVGYKGNGSAGTTIPHNLGVVPEMMWVKNRSSNLTWPVYHKDLTSANKYLNLGENDPEAGSTNRWNNTAPTSSVFTVGSGTTTNQAGSQFFALLFASVDGVSKVGSYSGNGTTLNIDCGFSSGARFVLIKRTDTTGSWWIFDTDRGLVAGNDAAITIDLPDAQFSTVDYIDPYSAGFSLTGTGGDINASGGSYIFYAIA